MFTRLIIALLALCAGSLRAQTVWNTGTGTAQIVWRADLLSAGGLSVATPANTGVTAFAVAADSSIKFVAPWGAPNSFLGGSLKSTQTVALTGPAGLSLAVPLELFAMKDTGLFEVRDEETEPVFMLDGFDVRFDPGLHALSLRQGNVRLTRAFSERIGHPELQDFVVGVVGAAVEVNEMDARIGKRGKPLPAACLLPSGTNHQVMLRSLAALQYAGETGRAIRVVAAFRFENLGPDAPGLATLAPLPLAFRVLASDAGGTTELARASTSMRVEAPEACPCPDPSRWYPGFTNHWTLADALLGGVWVELPEEILERTDVTLSLEASIPGSVVTAPFRPRRVRGNWLFSL